jgi:hypothetical protein
MADRETIRRVAKILARATSSEPEEASAALYGAYKRMVRDGVTLQDLLSLPVAELYQNTLVRLAEVIIADTPDLSPSERREAYSVYLVRIVAKFSNPNASPGGGGGASADTSDRARQSEEYEHRRRRAAEEQARRRQAEQNHSTAGKAQGSAEQAQGQQSRSAPGSGRGFAFTFANRRYWFSVDTFLATLKESFSAPSLFSNAVRHPLPALRLFAAGLLWGMAAASVVIAVAAVGHAVTGIGPLIDVRLRTLFVVLSAVATIWKVSALARNGWFERHSW